MDTVASVDALVEFIRTFVGERFAEKGGATDGASLANAIRQRFPSFTYESLGVSKLAEVVDKAEKQGLVTRNRQVSHLELLPGPAVGMNSVSPGEAHDRMFVRPDIWRAFFLLPQIRVNFCNRQTLQLVSLLPDAPLLSELEQNDQYVRLDQVSSETQREWARRYFEDKAPAGLFDKDRWWVEFSNWLRSLEQPEVARWNRYRAGLVRHHLEEWAQKHSIPIMSLLVPARKPPTVSQALPLAGRTEEQVRNAIMAAISEMSTDELGRLSIPLRYILNHFRAR